jgi:4'-phosphopantetheinyl transferase EntD
MQNLFPATFAVAMHKLWPQQHTGTAIAAIQETPLDNDAKRSGFVAQSLHPEEIRQAAGYRLPKRKNEFLAGRLCAKLALADYLDKRGSACRQETLATIHIISREDRRPTLQNSSRILPDHLDISITHSNDYGGALAADCPCGIDLQRIQPTLLKVQRYFCTTAEEKLLTTALNEYTVLSRLLLLWSAKEAVQKAYSYGHAMPGFLGLTVTRATITAEDMVLFRFFVNTEEIHEECQAIATLLGDNGLALCLLPMENVCQSSRKSK